MRKIKVVVLLVRQLQHGLTKNAKVSPNLTVTHIVSILLCYMHCSSSCAFGGENNTRCCFRRHFVACCRAFPLFCPLCPTFSFTDVDTRARMHSAPIAYWSDKA